MINGVLVERTVKDVVPALRINSEGLKKVLDDLVKQYKKQQDDMEKWKVPRSPTSAPGQASPSTNYYRLETEQYSSCPAIVQ